MTTPTVVRALPDFGPRVPGVTPRVALGLVGVALTVACYQPLPLLVLGVLLAVTAAALPQRLGAWPLMLFLAGSRLQYGATTHTWQLLVLLAGLHLLHLLATIALQVPLRSWLQVAVLRAPLLRFVAIQVPAQLVAGLVLALAPHRHGVLTALLPACGIAGGLALLAVGLLIAVPLLHERPR